MIIQREVVILILNINILNHCIDKLTKAIYNTIRFLCKNHYMKVCLCMAIAATVATVNPLTGYSADIFDGEGTVSLEASAADDEEIRLVVKIGDGIELCGFSASICYEAEALELITAKNISAEKTDLYFLSEDGFVRFILDGDGNIFTGCVAELVFAVRDGERKGELNFEIIPTEAYYWKNERLVRVRLYGGELSIPNFPSKDESVLMKASVIMRGEDCFLLVEGCSRSGCIAAGFDVTVFEVGSAVGESYRSVSVMPKSGEKPGDFLQEIKISQKGIVCVAVRPLTYKGREIAKGECEVFVFSYGALSDRFIVAQ